MKGKQLKGKRIRNLVTFLCSSCLVCSLTACAGQSGRGQEEPLSQAQVPSQEETTQSSADLKGNDNATTEEGGQPIRTETSKTNILIAYFTWADNTEVEDADAAIDAALSHYEFVGDRGNYDGVDAAASASVLVPGNTVRMAAWIQERTGGDLFSIAVSETYSSVYDECLDRAADEKAENARPGLQDHVENIEQNMIFPARPLSCSAPMAQEELQGASGILRLYWRIRWKYWNQSGYTDRILNRRSLPSMTGWTVSDIQKMRMA